jgi:tetratricopeptide (TPR) repeat protein
MRPLILTISLLLLGACAYGTRQRNEVWATEESLWKDVTLKSPKNGRGQMNYGLILMGRGDYSGAEGFFQRGLELWPYYSYLHINMGILKAATGKPEEAEMYLKKGIAYGVGASGKEDNPEAYYYYAKFLKDQKRFPEALQNLDNLFALTNAHLNGHYLQMEIFSECSNFAQLKNSAQQTLLISPRDETALMYLKKATESRSKIDQLIVEATNHPSPEAYLSLSVAFFEEKKYDLCITASREALKLRKDYPEAWNNIGAAYGELKNWKEEITACEEALKLKPDFVLARNNLEFAKKQ